MLVSILIALILATAIFPIVILVKKKIQSSLLAATIIVFTLAVIPVILFAIFWLPDLLNQIPDLAESFHKILSHLAFLPQSFRTFDVIKYINQNTTDFIESTKIIVATVISIVTVFFMTFYFILDQERFLGFFLDLFPRKEHSRIKATLKEIARVNGQYIRGNVIISFICALVLFVVLLILQVPYALPLAIFAGIMDLLPLVGSTIGTLPAIVIAFTISPFKGFLVLIIHLIYQQTENVVISPAIYNKALNVSPALSFLSIAIGAGLFGILGAFLALPIAASIPPTIRYVRDYSARHQEE
ncbi:hypothetical protein BH10BAC1_BH10BAC1_16630 [soil metagenome]